MKKLKLVSVGLSSAAIIGAAGLGAASAASPNSNGNVAGSDIPRAVFKEERQAAVAEVLNTTTATVQAAHQDHTLKQLISNAGLTRQTFGQKVKAQLTSDLAAKGYSQQQITIALQHKHIVHLRHQVDKSKKGDT